MNDPGELPDTRVFTHEAMNTTFSLRMPGLDDDTAKGMVRECGERLDFLESLLSRFVPGSDVSRINQLDAGETLYISEPCHQCLLLALDAYVLTGGLFDITLGTSIEHRKSGSGEAAPPLAGQLTVHPDIPAVTCGEPGREIDLGGIGKGFALDELKRLLTERGVEEALLAAGASSLLAFGGRSWPAELTGDGERRRIGLADESLSASGTGIQGSHIVHPAGAAAMPDQPFSRVWVTAATAALAEIWSTTLMLLPPGDIPPVLAENPEITSVHAERDGEIREIR